MLVNGGPVLAPPRPLRLLLGAPPFAQLAGTIFRWLAWSPRALRDAFVDPSRAPAEVVGLLAGRSRRPPPAFRVLGRLLRAPEDPPRPPRCRTLLLWGAEDRLAGTSAAAARKLAARMGAELALIADAGHFPQVEQPAWFLEALERFTRG